ncbi:MAG: hypothetical protein LUG18_09135 [Candidatus Azobacteroides sp.]|nr:hypothetical protein [Candidatus Azobacteroides sp.]
MLHYFNPGHEAAVANGSPYYMLPANQRKMQEDLAFLPAWYANPDDYVYIPQSITLFPEEYEVTIKDLLPSLGTPFFLNENTPFGNIRNQQLSLWGISPQSIDLFRKLNEREKISLQLPEWHKEIKDLTSRYKAKEGLDFLIRHLPEISGEISPSFFSDITSAEAYINASSQPLIVKAPYSSSGKGLVWIEKNAYTSSHQQILRGILKKQGSISIEKVLPKKVDFAMQFFINNPDDTSFKALSLFETKENGKYDGNIISSGQHIEKTITKFIPASLLEKVKKLLTDFLNTHFSPFYKGCIGIDMLIYETNGKYYLHPCVEINLRYNMGYLSYRIYEKYIDPGSKGKLGIIFRKEKGSLYHTHHEMKEKYPLKLSPDNRVISGYFPLCPVCKESRYMAFTIIRKNN